MKREGERKFEPFEEGKEGSQASEHISFMRDLRLQRGCSAPTESYGTRGVGNSASASTAHHPGQALPAVSTRHPCTALPPQPRRLLQRPPASLSPCLQSWGYDCHSFSDSGKRQCEENAQLCGRDWISLSNTFFLSYQHSWLASFCCTFSVI